MDLIKILKESRTIRQNDIVSIKVKVHIERIIEKICDVTGINPTTLSMRTRKREIVDARHIYCYIAKRETSLSLSKIGEPINRDHTSVLHAIKKIRNLKNNNKQIRNLINEIESRI